jgi:hypothetical protein
LKYQLEDYLANTKPDWSKLSPGTYWMAVGFEKTGKTTAFSTFSPKGEDGVLFLDLEQGVRTDKAISVQITSLNPPYDKDNNIILPVNRGLKDSSGNPIPSLSMAEALELISHEWANSGKTTLIIDTVDKLNLWCVEAAMHELIAEEKLKKQPNLQILRAVNPEDIPYAAAYTRGREKVMNVVNTLLDIIKDNGIQILISHLKKSISITDGRDVIVKRVPAMPEGLASRLGYNAEAIVTLEVDQAGKHIADFRGYSEVIMGTRIEPLHGRKFIWDKSGNNTLYNVIMSACQRYQERKDAGD